MNYFCKDCMVTKYVVQFEGMEKSVICPECGKKMVEEEVKQVRILNIMIQKYLDIKDRFSLISANALREYADLIEKTDGGQECYKFTSKNGCKIKMISGCGDDVNQ